MAKYCPDTAHHRSAFVDLHCLLGWQSMAGFGQEI